MEGFNVESRGLTQKEFYQVIHRSASRSILGAVGFCVVLYVVLMLLKLSTMIVVFPGSILLAGLLFFELKAFANYGKFDYNGLVCHYRFEPDRWVVIRSEDLNTRMEYTWADTCYLWETKDTMILATNKGGTSNCTVVKRCMTPEQMQAIRDWFAKTHK